MESGDEEARDRDPEGRPSGRRETEAERLDRNLSELLQELRVALPGVQVLFAFLLAVPFQQHFSSISAFDKKAYFATLLLTAISAALLIAPSAYHRRRWCWRCSSCSGRCCRCGAGSGTGTRACRS
jgi:hypothetical protein